MIAAATRIPEVGDEPSFKVWAVQANAAGIHNAYRSPEFGYDWLPMYLYVSKAVGRVYKAFQLDHTLGPYHHALTVLLKLTMTGFHLLTVVLVYAIGRRIGRAGPDALLPAAAVGVAPGTVLATAAFGYQDAFHTLIVVGALWCVAGDRVIPAAGLTVAAALTKPQAAIYLGPFWLFLLCRRDPAAIVKAAGLAACVILVTLTPFIYYGTLPDVFDMYLDVPRIHRWLTGCAHNVWWLVEPAPPFSSDRTPILPGINGLWIGISTFALFCALTAAVIAARPRVVPLAHGCAFLAFAFFMVVTQIHENHLYACFPFLAIAAMDDSRLRRLFAILTVTFAADLVLTLWLLRTGTPVTVGPVRLSLVNAAVNVAVLVVWTSWVARDWVVGWVKRPDRRGRRKTGGGTPDAVHS